MVLTHPDVEEWHRDAIREATGEYGIGIIFVPLFKTDTDQGEKEEDEEEEDLPILRPFDPTTISGFTSFDAFRAAASGVDSERKLKYGQGKKGNLEEEMVLNIDVGGNIENIIEEVLKGVQNVMSIGE